MRQLVEPSRRLAALPVPTVCRLELRAPPEASLLGVWTLSSRVLPWSPSVWPWPHLLFL